MKKRSFILVVLMVIFSVICLVGCGKQGEQGPQGDPGLQGIQGEKGDKGDQGEPGEDGEDGEDGEQGRPGEQGPQGPQGVQGEQGIQGNAGIDGREVEFQVNENGILWRYEGETEWKTLITFEDLNGFQSTYTLSFDGQGADAEVPSQSNIIYKSEVELPVPTKAGHYFLGWSDGEETYNGKYEVKGNVEFKAEWAYTVELDLNGGEIVGAYKTTDELKQAFITDLNAVLGSSYTVDSSFTWAGTTYKIFLDPTYGVKWRPLLQYFYDVDTSQKDTIQNPGKYPNAEYDLYEFWDELMAGQDLVEVDKDRAPYCVAFALQAWTKNTLLETTYHFSADYSSDEVQNLALDYFIPSKDTTLQVKVGENAPLPTVAKGDLGFAGWYDANGNKLPEVFVPTEACKVTAKFGAYVTFNTNINDENEVVETLPAFLAVAEDGADAALPTITRPHYTFEGWYDANGNKIETVSKATGILNVKASWVGDAHKVTYVNGGDLEAKEVEYGKKLGELTAGVSEGLVFDGWWSQDGSSTGEWGAQITSADICKGDVTAYAKFKLPYTVKLNYGDATGHLSNVLDAREAFLTDFYNWCIAKGKFTAEAVTKEAFIGHDGTAYTFNGTWVNYSGAAGNPSSLFPNYDSAAMANYFMAPKGEKGTGRECGVIENSEYFLNDADMNAKWGPYMAAIAKICNNAARAWGDEATNYFIYELGRTLLADDATFKGSYGQSCLDARNAVAPIEGCEHLLFSKYTEIQEYTVFSLTEENEFPQAYKAGYTFVGWTMGGRPYDKISAAELSGQTFTPVFVDTTNTNVFDIKWASARQAAKGEGALSITNITWANGENFPSAVFRDKVLLEYNEKGQLVVVAVGLNGVRITKDSSASFYVEGQSNLDYDLIIIGYSAEADTAIQALGLEAGDIIEIAALNSVYDVLDGPDPNNWSPDHEVNVKAYITYKE